MNAVMKILKEEGVKITGQSTTERCEIAFQVRKSHAQKLETRFNRLMNITLTMG